MPSSALPKKRINTSQRNEEETSNSELRPSAGAFATSSRALTSNHTLEDDQKQEYASSSGGVTTATNTSTTQSSTKTPLSPSPAPIQVSKKRREHHEHEGRFSFREPFLEKLRLMLDNETNADSGSIQWLDGEDAFVILDQNKFEKDIIPKYFTPIIFQSFLRKLYRWGFKRITTTHAGSYKFASATFTRSPAPSAASHGAARPAGIAVDSTVQVPFSFAPNNNTLEMLLRQQPAVNTQPNQLLSLLAQLQQNLQPAVQPQPAAVPRNNHLYTLLANAIAQQQQSLPQVQLRQQVNQDQANSILQILAQQLVNQSMLNSVPSNAFSPVPNQNFMTRAFGAPSQDPLVSFLNQNQVLNPYAPPARTATSSEQALALLMSISQNATTAASSTNRNSGNGIGAAESSSSTGTADPRADPSPEQPPSQRKRKHPHSLS